MPSTEFYFLSDEDLGNILAYIRSHTGEAAGGATFSGTAFFLNTNFYKLIIDSQTDIVTTPFVEPENQNVKIAQILFMGNAVCSNLRKQGVVYAISQSIAS